MTLKITMDDTDVPEYTPEELLARATEIAALDDDERKTLAAMTRTILSTLTAKRGAVVLMADVQGDGVAGIVACGNPELIPALLYTAAAAADAMFKKPELGMIQ